MNKRSIYRLNCKDIHMSDEYVIRRYATTSPHPFTIPDEVQFDYYLDHAFRTVDAALNKIALINDLRQIANGMNKRQGLQ